MAVNGRGQIMPPRYVDVIIQPDRVAPAAPRLPVDTRVLDNKEARAALRALYEVTQQALRHLAIGAGEFRIHRRHDDSVLELHRVDRDRFEELREVCWKLRLSAGNVRHGHSVVISLDR